MRSFSRKPDVTGLLLVILDYCYLVILDLLLLGYTGLLLFIWMSCLYGDTWIVKYNMAIRDNKEVR